MADGRHRTVSRNELDVVAQREELLANRTDQNVEVTAWKIGSTDRSGKQHIADERQSGDRIEERNMPRRMPRTKEHIKTNVANLNPIALLQPARRDKGTTAREPEHLGLPRHTFDPEAIINMRAFDRHGESFRQLRSPARVIDVPMRYEDSLDRNLSLSDERQQPIDIATGVNNRGALCLVTPQQSAVLLKRGHRDDLVLKSHTTHPLPEETGRRVYLPPVMRKHIVRPNNQHESTKASAIMPRFRRDG